MSVSVCTAIICPYKHVAWAVRMLTLRIQKPIPRKASEPGRASLKILVIVVAAVMMAMMLTLLMEMVMMVMIIMMMMMMLLFFMMLLTMTMTTTMMMTMARRYSNLGYAHGRDKSFYQTWL